MADDYRKQVVVALKVDGEDAVEKARVQIQLIQNALASATQELATGSKEANEYANEWRKLTGELRQWTAILDTVKDKTGELTAKEEALAAKQEDALQAGLRKLKAQADAADNAKLLAELENKHSLERAIADREAVEWAQLLEAEKKQQIEDQRILTELIKEQAQAERDLAAIRGHLGKKEVQSNTDDNEKEQIRFILDKNQAIRETNDLLTQEKQYKESLTRLERDSAAQRAANDAKRKEGLNAGLQAVADEMVSVREAARVRAEADAARDKANKDWEKSSKETAAFLDKLAKEELEDLKRLAEQQRILNDEVEKTEQLYGQIEAARAAREAKRQANIDANNTEGHFAEKAKEQIVALEQIAKTTNDVIERYEILDGLLIKLAGSGDREGWQRTYAQMIDLNAAIDGVIPATSSAKKGVEDFNQVVNAGAGYARNAGNAVKYTRDNYAELGVQVNAVALANGRMAASSGQAGYGILHVAHAIQDLQYGIGAVLNNIPLVVQAFGGTAGMAGGVMIAAVAADVILPKLYAMSGGLSSIGVESEIAKDGVEKLKDKIKSLEGNKVNVPVDTLELDNAKRRVEEISAAIQAFKRISKTQEHYEKESGQKVESIFAENNGPEVIAKMRADVVKEFMDGSSEISDARKKRGELEKRLASEKEGRDTATSVEELQMYNAQIIKTVEQLNYVKLNIQKLNLDITKPGGSADNAIGELFERSKSEHGAKQLAAQEEIARRLDKAGSTLGGAVRAVSPANLEEIDQTEYEQEESIENIKKWGKKNKESRKVAKDLTDQGVHHEKLDADAAKKEHDALVREYVTPFSQAVTGPDPKSLNSVMAQRLAAKQSPEKITADLTPQVENTARNAGVPAGAIKDVVAEVVRETLAKVRAEAAARNAEVAVGAGAMVDETKAKAERVRDAGNARAGRQRKQADLGMIAQGMQQDYGLSDEQAVAVAPHVQAKMKRGMNPQAAGQAAYAELQRFIQQQEATINGMQANQEAMNGVFGSAIQQLGAQRARNAAINQGINRAARGAQGGMFPPIPPR